MSAKKGVALITGASRGIGRTVAERLARRGYAVAMIANENERLAESASMIRQEGLVAAAYTADVRSSAEIEAAVRRAENELGPIEVVVNCAGIAYFGGVGQCTIEEWERTLDINVNGYFRVLKAAFPGMKSRGRGTVVNMSSVWGRQGSAAMAAYSTSKFAVEGLTASFAPEAQKAGVKVTSLVLDKVDTDFRDQMKDFVQFTPAQRERMLRADDVADAVDYVLTTSAVCLPESITLKAWQF